MDESHKDFYKMLGLVAVAFIFGWKCCLWQIQLKREEGPPGVMELHPKEKLRWMQAILIPRTVPLKINNPFNSASRFTRTLLSFFG